MVTYDSSEFEFVSPYNQISIFTRVRLPLLLGSKILQFEPWNSCFRMLRIRLSGSLFHLLQAPRSEGTAQGCTPNKLGKQFTFLDLETIFVFILPRPASVAAAAKQIKCTFLCLWFRPKSFVVGCLPSLCPVLGLGSFVTGCDEKWQPSMAAA